MPTATGLNTLIAIIAAGNCALVKPDETAPYCLRNAGLELPGARNTVPGDGDGETRNQAPVFEETVMYRIWRYQRCLQAVAVGSVAFLCSACTSTTFTDLSPQQLHEKIAAGEIIQPGQNATIVTADGNQQTLIVTAITDDQLIGKTAHRSEATFEEDTDLDFQDTAILINDIVSVEKQQISHPVGQAVVVAGSSLALIVLLALPAALVGALAL